MSSERNRWAISPAAIVAAAAGMIAAPTFGQAAIEVSADGRQVASPSIAITEGWGWKARGASVPYPTEPDIVVNLRRQIGGLAIADVNGNGHNDLIAVCYISQSFPPYENWQDMIFFGNGNGIETTPGWLSDTQTHTGDVLVGDLNNNGWPDIVTIHGGGLRRDTVRVYATGPGGVPTSPTYVSNTAATGWGTAGVLADFNQNGFLDLVTSNQGLSPDPFRPLLMFRNTGGVLSTAAVWQSATPAVQNGLDAVDLTGNGYPDLGSARWANFESGIYLNTDGELATSMAATVGNTGTDRGVAFADFTGDGQYEMAVGGNPSKVYTYSGGQLSLLQQQNPPFSGPQDFKAFDVNGDGWPDLVEIHFSDGRAHIYLNRDGVLDTEPSWTYNAPEVGTALAFGDLNGNGLPDLVLGYAGNTSIRVFFAIPQDCPADLTGDGNLNFFDVAAYLDLYNAGDPAADWNGDGLINFFDLAAYLDDFNAGCP
ncbi:MAG: FG-GAP-like repeat-containing protein [Phycisphaerales bacterium]|nr:VCBS repeat-containing protein [Planctomycetota bacterium]MCH8509266.1 FG-GAP-like repeat-containing protein [Phycisphaerales bacterium]